MPSNHDRVAAEKKDSAAMADIISRACDSRLAWLEKSKPSPNREPMEKDRPETTPPDLGDVPEADAAEQAQPWSDDEAEEKPRVDLDVPEADALDQARPADLDDDRT